MELSIFERLLILNIDTFPKVGSIVTMKIKQKLVADVGFTEQEIKDYNIVEKDGNVSWNDVPSVDIEIGPEAVKLLVSAMESSDNLKDSYVPLYDRLKEVK